MSHDGLPPGRANGEAGRGPAHHERGERESALDADQNVLDTDQTLSDVDQGASDADAASAHADRSGAVRDRAFARADQAAADRDAETSRAEFASSPGPVSAARRHAYDETAAKREQSTADRAAVAALRAQTAAEALDAADQRDEASRVRDLAAQARDRAAEARDYLLAQLEPVGPAAEARAQAAADRERAAADRERAAADRARAAAERRQVREALSEAHLDELTGTYRRGQGTLALQREIDRARHAGGRLVLAFVDVDGLKEVNDREGHSAGDALLVDVAATLRHKLRSYDPIVRYGGDEFVCAFCDFELERVQNRFEDIRAALHTRREGCSISVGLAQLERGDTLEDLTARGDAALYEAKRQRRSPGAPSR